MWPYAEAMMSAVLPFWAHGGRRQTSRQGDRWSGCAAGTGARTKLPGRLAADMGRGNRSIDARGSVSLVL